MFDNLWEKGLEQIMLSHPMVKPEMVTTEKIQQLKEMGSEHPEIIAILKQQKEQWQMFSENLGVLSLSAICDSILMWSHYAENHTGFCIGFKSEMGIAEDIQWLKEVHYSKKRNNDILLQFLSLQAISSNVEKIEKLRKDFLFTKSDDWSYEQEWRFLGTPGLGIYLDQHIDQIIFGVNMAPESKNMLRSLLKGKNIAFFQATKNNHEFKIDIHRDFSP